MEDKRTEPVSYTHLQIFLSMFLITLLGVGVLMNIVYKTSIDAIEQNYRASYQSTLKN